jgi:transposase
MSKLIPALTVGMDVGDRYSHLHLLDADGECAEEGRVRTVPDAIRRRFEALPQARVVIEAGTHSAWMCRLLRSLGHEVIVANPRQLRLIYASDTKSDRTDAEYLARVGRLDPKLLRGIEHRGERAQADLAVIKSRDALVRVRASLVTHCRGIVKSLGARLPVCSAEAFHHKVRDHVPEALEPALLPVLELVEQITAQVRAYNRQLEAMAKDRYPETQRLRQVTGVGPVTSLAYTLIIEDPSRFKNSRSVGAYVGLRPRRHDSGDSEPQLRITKAGNALLRRLLVQAAAHILGPFGPDSDLRRFGERISARGGKNARKRARVAVARKLAVLLHRLWVSEQTYQPLRNSNTEAVQAA